MSAERPVGHRTEKEKDHQSVSTREGVSWRATYTYEANGFKYTDEASLRDVSRRGCGIRGKTRLAIGNHTTITFYLMDQQRPLSVAARVIWVTSDFFGVQFLNLHDAAYERMQRYMRQVLDDPHTGTLETPPISKERRKANVRLALALLVLGALWGCAIAPLPSSPPSPPPSAPFFRVTSEDTTQLAMLASQLDTAALECASPETCDGEVHFARAVVSLFENREGARASFEQVITLHPSSPLAAPSALWLQLLRDEGVSATSTDPQRRILIELSAHWAREWIGRRLAASARAERKAALGTPVTTQAFQKQLQEKDRHIAELRFQLNALKIIDRDQADRHQKVRTPRIDNHR